MELIREKVIKGAELDEYEVRHIWYDDLFEIVDKVYGDERFYELCRCS